MLTDLIQRSLRVLRPPPNSESESQNSHARVAPEGNNNTPAADEPVERSRRREMVFSEQGGEQDGKFSWLQPRNTLGRLLLNCLCRLNGIQNAQTLISLLDDEESLKKQQRSKTRVLEVVSSISTAISVVLLVSQYPPNTAFYKWSPEVTQHLLFYTLLLGIHAIIWLEIVSVAWPFGRKQFKTKRWGIAFLIIHSYPVLATTGSVLCLISLLLASV